MEKENNYLDILSSNDIDMKRLIDKFGPLDDMGPIDPNSHYEDLLRSIIGQQLSVKAADTIWGRVLVLINNEITPGSILSIPDDKLRKTGLSRPKISYIKNLSESINKGDLDLESLHKLKDYEVIKELTKIKGIGVWTSEMFLILSLKRENVFSLGDLGLFNAMKALYNPLLTKYDYKTKEFCTHLQNSLFSATFTPYFFKRSYALSKIVRPFTAVRSKITIFYCLFLWFAAFF